MARGGKRAGAGRPPLPTKKPPRPTLPLRIPPDLHAAYRAASKGAQAAARAAAIDALRRALD